jgi:hypothetical protein
MAKKRKKKPMNQERRLKEMMNKERSKERKMMPPPSQAHKDKRREKRQDVKHRMKQYVGENMNQEDREFIAGELVKVARDLVRDRKAMDETEVLAQAIDDFEEAMEKRFRYNKGDEASWAKATQQWHDHIVDEATALLRIAKQAGTKFSSIQKTANRIIKMYDKKADSTLFQMTQAMGGDDGIVGGMPKAIRKQIDYIHDMFDKKAGIVASAKTAADSLIDYSEVIDQRDVAGLRSNADEITYKLAVDVYRNLRKRFELSSGEKEAIKRLQAATDMNNPEMIRNNVFKAADALGMKLPHSSF